MSFYIREARKAANITQAELATALGINRATLSKYENGNIEPSVSQLKKIADFLKIDDWTDLVDNNKAAQMIIDHVLNGLRDFSSNEQLRSTATDDFKNRVITEADELPQHIRTTIHRVGIDNFLESYKTLDAFLSDLGTLEDRLWYAFAILNDEGQQKAVERVEELTEIPKYQRREQPTDVPLEPPEDK